MADGAWVLAAPASAQARLAPLIDAHRQQRPVRIVTLAPSGPPRLPEWADQLAGAAGVLVAGDPRLAPNQALGGVFVAGPGDEHIPAGWIPAVDARLERFARAAAAVTQRSRRAGLRCSMAVLAQWEARSLAAADWAAAELARDRSVAVLHWTADRLLRRDIVPALRAGLGGALYFGHGLPRRCVGYGGLAAAAIGAAPGEPMGAFFSLTCRGADRRENEPSFGEELVLSGASAAALVAAGDTAHEANLALGRAICGRLVGHAAGSLGGLLRGIGLPPSALACYRIMGDPLALLVGPGEGVAQAQGAIAPASDEMLSVLPSAEGDRTGARRWRQ
jgi:hypothetical protein